MRVLHLMASGARGGGADHLLGLLPELRNLGVECIAAVGDEGPTGASLGELHFQVFDLQLMGSRWSPVGAAQIAGLVADGRPDLVHHHGTRAAFFGGVAAAVLGPRIPPALYTAHGLSYRKEMSVAAKGLFLQVEAWCCYWAAAVLSVSKTDLRDLGLRGFVESGAGHHLPNAVDTARFGPGDRQQARRRLDLPEEAFVVGTVSRLVPQKAVADLVAAVGLCREIVLVVVGDGPLRKEIESAASSLGERVRLLGSRSDVPEILPAFDLFALTSRWEGEPIALLEAMAAGIPCVATATEGAMEILEPNGVGELVEIGNPERFSRVLESLRRQPDRRREMARAGREAVEDRTYRRSAERVLEIYRAVLKPG